MQAQYARSKLEVRESPAAHVVARVGGGGSDEDAWAPPNCRFSNILEYLWTASESCRDAQELAAVFAERQQSHRM